MLTQDTTIRDGADSQILHPGSRRLFSLWETLRAEQAYPTREAFGFDSIKDLMPDLVVLDRDNIRNSYKFRLAGSRVCRLFNENQTGKDALAGWDNFESDVVRKHLTLSLTEYQPALVRMRMKTDTGQVVAAEMIALPVQMRGSNRVQLIGGLFAFRDVNAIGHNTIVGRELISARMIWTEHREAPRRLAASAAVRPKFGSFAIIKGGKVD
jgi:hypothetical protein